MPALPWSSVFRLFSFVLHYDSSAEATRARLWFPRRYNLLCKGFSRSSDDERNPPKHGILIGDRFCSQSLIFVHGQGCGMVRRRMERQELFQGLTHLRKALLLTAVMVIGLGILIFPFSKSLLRHIYEANLRVDLVAFSIPEAFFSLLKVTLYASLFLSIPLLFYQLLRSFSSFLKARGVTSLFPILFTAVFLFYLGAFFCYFVTLPYGINFLMGYQSAHLRPLISVGKYVSFCFVFIFGFGLTFELPLILALMSTLNIVKAAFLTRNRRYAILLIAILSAVITPTPDFFNMTLMGGPLYILFEVGVILVKIIERKRKQAGAAFKERAA